MHDIAPTYDRENYEKELRKLVCRQDEPGRPVTPYGQERERIRRLLQSPGGNPSRFLFSYPERPSLFAYDAKRAEFVVYDSEGKRPEPLFYEPAQSECLLRYMVEEIYYRALEVMAARHFNEARNALGYKGDTDGRVYEMYQRVREESMDKWLSDMPGPWKRKDQLAIVDGISLTISRYALFLFFGAMQKIHVPGILERLFDSLSDQNPLEREVERIFPEQGYTVLGIGRAALFATAYEQFLTQTSRVFSDPRYPYMPDLWIINPQPSVIDLQDIDFYKLTTDTTQLRNCLERCLKRDGSRYVEKALQQWRSGEATYANRWCVEPLRDNGREQAENDAECLKDRLKSAEAEAEVLRREVKERNGEIRRMNRELKEHVQELQALVAAQKKLIHTAAKEKERQTARLEEKLKEKELKIAGMEKERRALAESRREEEPFPEETGQLLKKEIQALKKERQALRKENKSLKEEIRILSGRTAEETGSGLLDRLTSSLRHYESDLYDNGLVQDWAQTEKLLIHIFNDVPKIMEAIRQIHTDRLRLVKEQRKKEKKEKGQAAPAVFINENKGPIVTAPEHPGPANRKLIKPTEE